MLEYMVDGQPYQVDPKDKDAFESKFPNFEFVGKTADVATMDTVEEDVTQQSQGGLLDVAKGLYRTSRAIQDPVGFITDIATGAVAEGVKEELVKEDKDEVGFFEGIGRSFENTPTEIKGWWYNFQLGMAPYIEFMGGPDAARVWLGDFDPESLGQTGLLDPDTNEVVKFNNEAYKRDGHGAEENERYYELIKLRRSVPRYEENPVKVVDIKSGKTIESKVAEEAKEKFQQTIDNQKKFLSKFVIYNKKSIPSSLFVSGNFDLSVL